MHSRSCSEGDHDIENAAVTSPHTSFVAESSTNFPAVSQSGDDISRYQPPNSEKEGYFDDFFQKTIPVVLIFGITSLLLFLSI